MPEGILRQMGAYRAALAAIWPGRRVETAILWTRTARLMPLPGPLVAAALARASVAKKVAPRPFDFRGLTRARRGLPASARPPSAATPGRP